MKTSKIYSQPSRIVAAHCIVPWLLMPPHQSANPLSLPLCTPLSLSFPLTDCIFRHLCGRRWVSFVSLISCLSVARFNFKSSSAHFHEWLSPGKNGTAQHSTGQDSTGHGTARHGTAEDSLGPHWDRQLTMLSRNFTRRWFRANEFDSIVSSFFPTTAARWRRRRLWHAFDSQTVWITTGRGNGKEGEQQPGQLASCRDRQPRVAELPCVALQ